MLDKDDKKLRLKIEVIGICAVMLMLVLLIVFKGNIGKNGTNTDNAETLPTETETTVPNNEDTTNASDEAVESNPTEQEEDKDNIEDNVEVESGNNDNTEQSNVTKQDTESSKLVTEFMTGVDIVDEFNPIYSIYTSLRPDENGALCYSYSYRADDVMSKGNYSNLSIEINKDMNNEIERVTFTLGAHNNLQAVETAKAKIAETLSKIFETDLYSLSTVGEDVEFKYNGKIYKAGLSQTLSYEDDYNIMYYTVENQDKTDTNYSEHKKEIDKQFTFDNITRTKKLDLSDDTFINEVKAILDVNESSHNINEASIFETDEYRTEKAVFDLDKTNLTIESSLNKSNNFTSYLVRFSNTGKTEEELRVIGKRVSEELFDVTLPNKYATDEERDITYITSKNVVVKVDKDNLEVATANSNYDFNVYANSQMHSQADVIEPELYADPETMETTYVYPDIQGEEEPEATFEE